MKLTKPNFPWNTRRNWETKTNSHIERIPFVDKAPRKLKEQNSSHSFQCFIHIFFANLEHWNIQRVTSWNLSSRDDRTPLVTTGQNRVIKQRSNKQFQSKRDRSRRTTNYLVCDVSASLKRRLTFVKSRKFSCYFAGTRGLLTLLRLTFVLQNKNVMFGHVTILSIKRMLSWWPAVRGARGVKCVSSVASASDLRA